MILSLSWRNIWRNKVRSLVIIMAITIGIFAGVFSWAFYRGMVNQRVQAAIATESSHIQVHARNYMINPEQKNTLKGADSIASVIRKMEGVKEVSGRILVNAMIASAETGTGIILVGIDPGVERQVTQTHLGLTGGDYFTGNSKSPIVIGEKLADKLSVRLKSRVVLTLQTTDGSLTTGLFRVSGIYKTSNSSFDEMRVFVRAEDASKLINLKPGVAHELAVLLENNDAELLNRISAKLKAGFPALDVATWRDIMPEVSIVEESMDIMMGVFMGVILAALISGIINTMLMAVLERVKELGMLMAVGMNKRRVFRMILSETVLLTLTGGLLGIAAGYFITLLFARQGIDLSRWAEAYEKLGYDTVVYPVIEPDIALKVVAMVVATGIIAAIYPAMKAIRLNPAEALHIDM